jgi:hypothetical protein
MAQGQLPLFPTQQPAVPWSLVDQEHDPGLAKQLLANFDFGVGDD